MSLYYDDELNLKEIGAVLKVSESRICQIHGRRCRDCRRAWPVGETDCDSARGEPYVSNT
jgi:hypothetical protein